MASDNEFVFLPLGGSGEIGMNLNLFGFGPKHKRQWIMVDCGVTFADLTNPGIDLICPDPSFILDQRENLLGLFLTHGHEDHIGAVAVLAPLLECPIFATPFTAALVQRKLDEAECEGVELNVIDMASTLRIGPFGIEYVTLTHSIPEPSAMVITTKLGTILHTGDWKIDVSPTLGPMLDSARIRELGDAGLMAMICDSTNVMSAGESGSEASVRASLVKLIKDQPHRVAVTTFASNVARVVSICEAAIAADRSVCLLGRSMLRIVDAARETGLLPANLTFVEPKEAGHFPREHILYLCTGSQGEPRAALSRIARNDHRDLVLSEGDTVIFSSKIIPGNEREIFDLQNDFVDLGVHVITEKDEFIHVSGHPCQDELKSMYEWARPRIAIPVHGEARHLEAHADFAINCGVEDALAPRNGDLIKIAPDGPEIVETVPVGRWYLDGDVLTPDGDAAQRERRKLGYAGIFFVSVGLSASGAKPPMVQISAMGVVLDDEEPLFETLNATLKALAPNQWQDEEAIALAMKRSARVFFDENWGKRPVIEIHIHRAVA